MIQKPLREIGLVDLQQLVTNKVAESRSIEYKQTLPGNTDSEKKEFLADVSAFANAIGGDLVYGITEAREDGKPTGIAESIDGLPDVNADAELRRLESMLRDGVQPRIQGLQFQWIDGALKGPVLVIRIPRSWAGPHMVIYQQHSRFYARNASSKSALDVFELRQAFLGSGSIAERTREFRAERVGHLVAEDTPVPLNGSRIVCVHFIPHIAIAGGSDIDLLLAANQHDSLQPFYSAEYSWGHTFNLDGLLTNWPVGRGDSSVSYLQLYRTGIIESATTGVLTDRGDGLKLYSGTFAEHLAVFLNRARNLMKRLDINAPASLYVSLLGAKGAKLGISQQLEFYRDLHPRPFDRDHLLLRELFLMDWEGEPMTILKPLLHELWQAAGLPRCFDYDESGVWKPLP